MVPEPVPVLVAVSVKVWRVKVAVTLLFPVMVTVQVDPAAEVGVMRDLPFVRLVLAFADDEPSQPVQLVKVEPVAGVGVRVTTVPESKSAVQVDPQSIPEGLLATVPEPLPGLVTARE